MTDIDYILSEIKHRPFELPKGEWGYYQEWNWAIFLHWKVPVKEIRDLVPSKLKIDTFDGNAYVSLVAFTMEKIRPRYLPAIKFISCFDEINLRTYIDNDNKKGVYFLNIEAGKLLSSLGLGNLKLTNKPDLIHYSDGVKVVAWKRQKIWDKPDEVDWHILLPFLCANPYL